VHLVAVCAGGKIRLDVLQFARGREPEQYDVHGRCPVADGDGVAPFKEEVGVGLRVEIGAQAFGEEAFDGRRSLRRRPGVGSVQSERRKREARRLRSQQDAERAAPSFRRPPEAACDQRLAREHASEGHHVSTELRKRPHCLSAHGGVVYSCWPLDDVHDIGLDYYRI